MTEEWVEPQAGDDEWEDDDVIDDDWADHECLLILTPFN